MLTVPGLCWLCRMPGLPATHSHLPCGRCLQKPPPWQRLVTVADYAPPLSLLIHQLKFSRRSEIASALSRLLLLEVLHARRTTGLQLPDRIISVPLWQRRHWRRGFNQSDLLCQPLSRWLHCQWDSEAVTTGSTVAEIAQLLLRNGAATVQVWCLCRTL